jgi:DNA polymerase-3 subunit delta
MKIPGRQIDSFIANPPEGVLAVLVYGPDAGLVNERCRAIVLAVAETLDDPFRVVELAGPDLAEDPGRLGDEAAAVAFGGGRRVVWVRDAADRIAPAFETLVEGGPGDSLVIASAGNLGPRSALRRMFEGASAGAAIPCYEDDQENLFRLARSVLGEAGLSISREALDTLSGRLGADRLASRREIEKLALYVGAGQVEAADVEAAVGDGAAYAVDDVVLAAASGEFTALDQALVRSFRLGNESIGILRSLARHLQQLHTGLGLVAAGTAPEDVPARLRPPVFFKHRARVAKQVRRWSGPGIEAAMEVVSASERGCKRTAAPAREICSRALFQIAAAALRQSR